ncbi:MAG TPA: uroporphyrinogen decarboxylase family protein [Spirochaetia bacterium]|nr:uroporphyrinogen decarboxylase family protein [Spirochaetia bacterium]
MEKMSSRERWLAAIKFQPVDRLPFWPKLEPSYPRAQNRGFERLGIEGIHDWIGSDNHSWLPSCVREVYEGISKEVSRDGNSERMLFRTERGSVETLLKFDVISQGWHPVEMAIRTLEDLKVMTDWFSACRAELNGEGLAEATEIARRLGSGGVTAENIGESPLMFFVEWLAGIENAHYLLADHRTEVEALFAAIHGLLLKKTEIVAENSPADLLYFTENTSTTLISPQQYRDFCLKHIADYGRIINGKGRNFVLHMCGHLKKLLPDLVDSPAVAFEAFTSPPVGNTRLLDGRLGCPDKCLIGGTNATLWLKNPDDIIAEIEDDLEKLPDQRGLIVTSAGVMPPLCKPETIKAVCDWVKSYRPRV